MSIHLTGTHGPRMLRRWAYGAVTYRANLSSSQLGRGSGSGLDLNGLPSREWGSWRWVTGTAGAITSFIAPIMYRLPVAEPACGQLCRLKTEQDIVVAAGWRYEA